MATATRLSSDGSAWGTGGTTQVSASITPGTNCFLVACITGSVDSISADSMPGTMVSSGSGPSWTSRADTNDTTSFVSQGSIWTAAIGGSDPGSFTVTWTRGSSGYNMGARVLSIWKVTGHDTGTPQAGAVAVTHATTGDGAVTDNLAATPASGDIVIMQAFSDDDDSNNSTITLSNTNRTWSGNYGGSSTTISAPWVTATSTGSTSTALDVSDLNPGDSHNFSSSVVGIIIKAAAAASTSLAGPARRVNPMIRRK